MIIKATKKPVTVEAVQFMGDNYDELKQFVGDSLWHAEFFENGLSQKAPYIKTLEGDMKASVGDYVIKGVKGEFYPCKQDVFEATYTITQIHSDIPDTSHIANFRNAIIEARHSYAMVYSYKAGDDFIISSDIIYDGYEGTVKMRNRLQEIVEEMNNVINYYENNRVG